MSIPYNGQEEVQVIVSEADNEVKSDEYIDDIY